MIEVRYSPGHPFHVYEVRTGPLRYAYPSATYGPHFSVLIRPGRTPRAGPPPSETLRALIAANAPWYAVLDRLTEEYPQWAEHFETARA